MKPIELPQTFTRSGWRFDQVETGDNALMYKKTDAEGEATKEYFEVFERREVNTFEDFEYRIMSEQTKVSYPGDNAFGAWAWGFTDINKAYDKFTYLELR